MKKEYKKPYIITEDFLMTQSIAAGCAFIAGPNNTPPSLDINSELAGYIKTYVSGGNGIVNSGHLFSADFEACKNKIEELGIPEDKFQTNVFTS